MKQRYFLCLAICMTVANFANAQLEVKKITLKEAVDIALKNNPRVAEARLQTESSAIQYNQSKRNLLPSIEFNLNNGLNQGRSIDPTTNSYANQSLGFSSYAFGGNLMLFNGFLFQNAIRQNNLALEASKMAEQQVRESITIDVMLTYLQILSQAALLTQSNLQAELTRAHVKRLQLLDNGGVIPPYHLYELEGQLATNELSITNARNSLNVSRFALAQLMNVDFVPEISQLTSGSQVTQKYGFPVAEIKTAALNHLALITGVKLLRESAEKAVLVSKAQRYPSLSLGSNWYSNFSSLATQNELLGVRQVRTRDFVTVNGNPLPVISSEPIFLARKTPYTDQLRANYNSSISLNLRIPVLNSSYSKFKIAESKVQLKRAELNEQTAISQVKQAVDVAYMNLESAWERLQSINKQVEAFQKAFQAAEARFKVAVGTPLDYSTAKSSLDAAQINLINARYDYLLRVKILDYYRGDLTLTD